MHSFVLTLSLDAAALNIKALILGMPHREGLTRQCAIVNDRTEQIVLFHTREQEAYGILGTGKRFYRFGAVDIVYRSTGVLFDVIIDKDLQRADR